MTFHQQITRLDRHLRLRIAAVEATARAFNERGVVEWAQRAVADAQALGRLRDRDIANLDRLERTFDDDFYRGQPSECYRGAIGTSAWHYA